MGWAALWLSWRSAHHDCVTLRPLKLPVDKGAFGTQFLAKSCQCRMVAWEGLTASALLYFTQARGLGNSCAAYSCLDPAQAITCQFDVRHL